MCKILFFAVALLVVGLQAANILPGDSGYELKCGYFSNGWDHSASKFRLLRSAEAPEGSGYAEISFPAGLPNDVVGPKLSLKSGQQYVFSCYIKADLPMEMQFISLNNKWQDTQRFSFEVTAEWQRIEIPFVPKVTGEYFLIFEPENLEADSVVSLDAVQLETGEKATPFITLPQLNCAVTILSENNRIFFNDESVPLIIQAIDTRSGEAQEVTCKLSITDWSGKIVRESDIPMAWQGRFAEEKLELTGLLNGLYVVRSRWIDEKGAELAVTLDSFAVVAQPRPDDPEIMPYGGVNSKMPAGVERIGIRWVEVGAYWKNLEPAPGEYNFDYYLGRIRSLHERGFKVKLSVFHLPAAPKWAWRPEEKAEMESWGLREKNSLLPTDESLKNLEVCIEKFLRAAGDMVDLFEIGGEDELICGDEPYYRRKYPESVINGCVNGPVCDGLAKVVKAYIAGARRANPELLIAAGRPSGDDCYNNNFGFSRNVLSQVKSGFDLFGMDCYSVKLRYIDTAKLAFIGSPDRELPGVFERAKKLCSELENQIPFVSEYGFAIDNTQPPDSPLFAEQTWRMLHASLLSRLHGSPLFYWFNTKDCVENGHYEYGLWHDTRVMLLVPALSQLNQVLEGVHRYEGQLTAESGLRLGLFGQRDRAILALWNGSREGTVELDIPAAARMVDFLGNPAEKSANGQYIAKPMPVYFIMDGPEAYDALKKSFDSVKDTAFPFTCRLELKDADDCAIVVESNDDAAAAVMEFATRRGVRKDLVNAGGYPWRVAVQPEELPNNLEVKLSDAQGRVRSCTLASGFQVLPEGTTLIDEFGATRDGIYPPDPHLSWHGGHDLGGCVMVTCDKETITFEAAINDDFHHNNFPIHRLWMGDCLQLFISPKVIRTAREAPRGVTKEDTEVLMTIQNGEPKIYFSSNSLQMTAGKDFSVTRDDDAGITNYRITLPREALGLAAPGRFCGISFVVFDDDDGSGQSYFYQLSPGVAGGKDTELLPIFLLR